MISMTINSVAASPRLLLPRTLVSCDSLIQLAQHRYLTSDIEGVPPNQNQEQAQQRQNPQHQSQFFPSPSKNPKLEAIKFAGLSQLHTITQDLISRSRQPLFPASENGDGSDAAPSIAQLQESARLERALLDALSQYSARHDTFSIGGESIDVLGVEVSPDLRHARAYWCLPYGLDLRGLSEENLGRLIRKMQQILDERGGKLLALVTARLRAYYPPKIKFVPAQHLSKDLKRGFSPDEKMKKWR